MSTLKRPSFGCRAGLGALYDARSDSFLQQSLIDIEKARDAVHYVALGQSNDVLSADQTFKQKFKDFGVGDELACSLLSGMIDAKGATSYLLQPHETQRIVFRAFRRVTTTGQETLNTSHESLKSLYDYSIFLRSRATHFVASTTWGARTIVALSRPLVPGTDVAHQEAEIDLLIRGATMEQSCLLQPSALLAGAADDKVSVSIYSDLVSPVNQATMALQHAFRSVQQTQQSIKSTPGGHGVPISYTLLPISFLMTQDFIVPELPIIEQPSSECVARYIALLDDLSMAQQTVLAYHRTLLAHGTVIQADHIRRVHDKLVATQHDSTTLMTNFGRTLAAVRAGKTSSESIRQLVENYWAGTSSPSELLSVMNRYADKLDFLSLVTRSGAQYISLTGQDTQAVRKYVTSNGTSYVFSFNNQFVKDSGPWNEHVALLRKLLYEESGGASVIVADYEDDVETPIKPSISVYVNGQVKTKDLLKDRNTLASKHLIRFPRHVVERVDLLPSQRRSLVLPCPGPDCANSSGCQWTCSSCIVAVEYSPTNGYLYCDCGKIQPDAVQYHCQRADHGAAYAKYPARNFVPLVQNLPPTPEINILILGETGVGKSTFINAFVNYLTFPTLDDGMDAAKLNWVISSSFHTQVTDPQTGQLISTKVQVGEDENEHDTSKGASATQQATVYPLYINGTLVRLIDTPGIGDVRGIEQDKQNLANVLSVLRNYSNLHGILILLKPNNARLNVMFRFTVKELLSSLHRSAAANIAFGFTNTRGSDYKPGDTFAPLHALLSDYNDVIPGLYNHNVYCFDSESFRFLAAQKQGVEIGTVEDYKRSWDQSTKEADRLIAYFRGLPPHHVQETLSMNETRHLISQLTQPMQQISQAITDSIANNAKQVQDLADIKLTGKELSKKLQIQKVVVKATQLDRPKTVCSHESCVTPAPGPEGIGGTILLRKSLCHNPCYLTEVPPNVVGTGELIGCAAFQGTRTCSVCEHDWSEHEHIMVEYSKTSETSTDPQVQAALSNNGNLATAKEAQIRALQKQMAELQHEHNFIQEASAKFSVYMKKNSITHYNDATIEYMEVLIKDERSKVRNGESRQRLERLEKDKIQYESYVAAMESGKKLGTGSATTVLDEHGVAALVNQLYNLKHYGRMLRDISKVVGQAYKANFRERPYRISGRKVWSADPQPLKNGQADTTAWVPVRQNFRPGSAPMIMSSASSLSASASKDKGLKRLTSRLKKRDPKYSEKNMLSTTYEDEMSPQPVRSIIEWDNDNTSELNGNNDIHNAQQTSGPPPYTETVSVRSPGASLSRTLSSASSSRWSKLARKLSTK